MDEAGVRQLTDKEASFFKLDDDDALYDEPSLWSNPFNKDHLREYLRYHLAAYVLLIIVISALAILLATLLRTRQQTPPLADFELQSQQLELNPKDEIPYLALAEKVILNHLAAFNPESTGVARNSATPQTEGESTYTTLSISTRTIVTLARAMIPAIATPYSTRFPST